MITPEEAEAKINEQRVEITREPKNLEEQAISPVSEHPNGGLYEDDRESS